MNGEETILPWRQKIDSLDGQILRLLNQRAQIVLEIGKVKEQLRKEPFNLRREMEILRRLEEENPGPFPHKAVPVIFREIISACRSLEVELTVVYFGPQATYTHLACLEHFGQSVRALPKENIQDVFEAVEKEKASYGVVPVENSTEGIVSRTLDMFIDSDVKICGEVLLRISHDLLSRSGRREEIRTIYSHPQALGQCRQWLGKNFPQAPLVETISTAKAAQRAAEDPQAAAIASSLAAHLYDLEVIESRIEDYAHNYTRFLVIGKELGERTGRDKTSLLFSIPDSPGALYEVLKPFSEKAINLTKIESRPIKDKPWEYVFFLDFEGHPSDAQAHEAISEMRPKVLFFKFLGCYPRSS